jgi:hypothetical protein
MSLQQFNVVRQQVITCNSVLLVLVVSYNVTHKCLMQSLLPYVTTLHLTTTIVTGHRDTA